MIKELALIFRGSTNICQIVSHGTQPGNGGRSRCGNDLAKIWTRVVVKAVWMEKQPLAVQNPL